MEEEKVSIIGLLRTLYQKKKLIYKITGVFVALGIFIYIISPREYSSSATLLSESQSSGLAGLSSLASLAGVNLGNNLSSSDGINSTLYEEVLNSTPFLNKLIKKQFFFPSVNKNLLLGDYLINYSRQPILKTIVKLPSKLTTSVTGLFKNNTEKVANNKVDTGINDLLFTNKVFFIQKTDSKAVNELKNRLTYNLDIRTGLVELDFDLQDKVVAAQVMKQMVDELSFYVINYETQKVRRSLQLTEVQLAKSQKRYTEAQTNLASFRDRNRNMLFNIPKTEDDRLQAQLNLEFNVYNGLLQQREQLRLKLANETPAISVIEPPQVAPTWDSPNFLLIMLICIFLGFFIGSTFVLVKNSIIQIIS
ncbi:hypothetical protein FFF34_003490 [Inquilinus sp. KBS0705]|nr:hypothetical protein FFF34_003490 [Inquilinus sp. KBS0705]